PASVATPGPTLASPTPSATPVSPSTPSTSATPATWTARRGRSPDGRSTPAWSGAGDGGLTPPPAATGPAAPRRGRRRGSVGQARSPAGHRDAGAADGPGLAAPRRPRGRTIRPTHPAATCGRAGGGRRSDGASGRP